MPLDTILHMQLIGFVGICTLQIALAVGYSVKTSVRTLAKAESIRCSPALAKYDFTSRLELPIVPDITVDGAFDDALKNATYVIHVASPLAKSVPPKNYNGSCTYYYVK